MLKPIGALATTVQLGPGAMAIPPITRFITRRGRAAGRPHHVALTFDDGPDPDGTPAVLEILAANQIKATFFLIGEQVQRHPDTTKLITAGGHDVAVHGWDHQLLLRRGPPQATVRGIRRARDLITLTTGTTPRWDRPPYGFATGPALVAAHRSGLTPVWWTSHGRDWSEPDPAAITRRILRIGRPGHTRLDGRDVLLLHDSDRYARRGSWKVAVAALPQILSAILRTGQSIGPL